MGQQTQASGRSTLMHSSVPPVEVDYIVCGLCQRDFPLANIVSFMQHKRFDCDDFRDYQGFRSRILLCKSCPRKFNTPWRLLQHAQSVHSLHIYFEQPELLPSTVVPSESHTTTTQGYDVTTSTTENPMLPSTGNFGDVVLNTSSLDLHNYSIILPAQQGKQNVYVHTTTADNSNISVTEQVRIQNVAQSTDDVIQREKQTDGVPVVEIVPTMDQNLFETSKANTTNEDELATCDETQSTNTEISGVQDNACAITNGGTIPADSSVKESGADRQESGTVREGMSDSEKCCDNQECGITFMPVTHEEPKKCCNAVLPKKRKRHMQTKHMSAAARLRWRSTSKAEKNKSRTQTVFIDIDPSVDSPDCSPMKQHCRQSGTKEDASAEPVASEVHINGTDETTTPLEEHESLISNSGKAIDLNKEIVDQEKRTSESSQPKTSQKGTYIIEPGTTISIPVSGNVDLASMFSTLISHPSNGTGNIGASVFVERQSNNRSSLFESGANSLGFLDLAQTIPRNDSSSLRVLETNKLMIDVTSDEFDPSFPGGREGSGSQPKSKMFERNSGIAARRLNFKDIGERRRRYPTSKPFKCDQCNQAFNQRIHLKKHQSKHTGIKPFQCEQCDYSTVEKSHLKVHIRVHTGEKPFKCTYCEYATAQNSTLKIHLKRHLQGTVGLRCLQCKKEFVEPERLTSHSRTEHRTHRQVIVPDTQTIMPDTQTIMPDTQTNSLTSPPALHQTEQIHGPLAESPAGVETLNVASTQATFQEIAMNGSLDGNYQEGGVEIREIPTNENPET